MAFPLLAVASSIYGALKGGGGQQQGPVFESPFKPRTRIPLAFNLPPVPSLTGGGLNVYPGLAETQKALDSTDSPEKKPGVGNQILSAFLQSAASGLGQSLFAQQPRQTFQVPTFR